MKHDLEARHESKNQEEGMRKRLEFTCFPVVSKSAITCFPRSLFYFYCYCSLSLSQVWVYEAMKWEGEENRVKTERIFARIFGRTKHSLLLLLLLLKLLDCCSLLLFLYYPFTPSWVLKREENFEGIFGTLFGESTKGKKEEETLVYSNDDDNNFWGINDFQIISFACLLQKQVRVCISIFLLLPSSFSWIHKIKYPREKKA